MSITPDIAEDMRDHLRDTIEYFERVAQSDSFDEEVDIELIRARKHVNDSLDEINHMIYRLTNEGGKLIQVSVEGEVSITKSLKADTVEEFERKLDELLDFLFEEYDEYSNSYHFAKGLLDTSSGSEPEDLSLDEMAKTVWTQLFHKCYQYQINLRHINDEKHFFVRFTIIP